MQIKKIAILGAESTGKTEWCQRIATKLNEPYTLEYARAYLEEKQGEYSRQDLFHFATKQTEAENEQMKQASKFLLCDTDIMNILVWSEYKYGCSDLNLLFVASQSRYDAYIITYPYSTWVADGLREYPNLANRIELYKYYLSIASYEQVPILQLTESSGMEEVLNFLDQL